MKTRLLPAIIFVALSTSVCAQTLFGPSPYLQQSDSPFFAQIQLGTVLLETFEDGLFNIPGVIASAGAPFGPAGNTDSVDADDGSIDGSGNRGWSFFSGFGSAGINFTFTGTLPTRAGIVWTDGGGAVTFQAFDQNGLSLGTFPNYTGGDSFGGETAEDRFYGALNAGGLSRIFISNASGGIEVDHLQFGTAPTVVPPINGVPDTGSTLSMLGGVLGLLGTTAHRFRK